MEAEGTIVLELGQLEAVYLGNLLAARAALMSFDIQSVIDVTAMLQQQEQILGASRLNALQMNLHTLQVAKWPEIAEHTVDRTDPDHPKKSTYQQKRAEQECAKKGHCACEIGDLCCFCNQLLTADSKRRPNVEPGNSDASSGFPGFQSNRPLQS